MKRLFTALAAFCMLIDTFAQGVNTASSSMAESPWAQQVPFDIAAEGEKFNFVTGMGGWSWDEFAYKQRNWVGVENLGIARIGFLGRNSTGSSLAASLSDTQKTSIDTELANISETGVKSILLLCDMDPESSGKLSESSWVGGFLTSTSAKNRRNYYVNEMALAVQYVESKGYTVVAVAPFNEPDYNVLGNCGGTAKAFNVVAEAMQGNAILKGRVFGPNTLNNSQGKTWYNTVKNNINWVNTHQLDGTFDDLVSFWRTGVADGKRALADEMHNVLEPMIAMNYGATYGTWWGYDGVARAEFSRVTNMGKQLAYSEDRENWAVAGVYRYNNDKNKARAIIGTSERNALPTAFTYLSKGRLAYYDGHGPVYDYTQPMPGGTDYWTGQTNAERLINIHTGEDVPMWNVKGDYKLVNKKSGKVLSTQKGEIYSVAYLCQYADGLVPNQVWSMQPVGVSVGGDFSYHFITNANTSSDIYYLDDLDWSLQEGQKMIIYPGGGSSCEQWHVRYVGNGYYTIVNRHSGLCLEVLDGSTADGAYIVQRKVSGTDEQLWKIVPANAFVDGFAPAKPTSLSAISHFGSILLQWTASTSKDVYGYNIYRYNPIAEIWECIGRGVKGTSFLDNTCRKGQTMRYRIKAVDKSINLSDASDEVMATTNIANGLVGYWSFACNLKDTTNNQLHAVRGGEPAYEGSGANAGVVLDGVDQFVKLPYHVSDMQQMTFAAWVRGGSTEAWQRIFDFGNGEDEYLFLTPTNGSAMRFEIKKDGVTQGLNATTTLGTGTWKHVAVTIGANEVAIYIDGVKNASTSNITIRPSDIAPTMSYLGRSQFDADPTFKGSIGDVHIYNYALSADEIAVLARQKSSPQGVDSPYELTAEFIPSLAEASGNWTTTTGYTTVISGYTRIYKDGMNKIDGTNLALKTLSYMPAGNYRVTAQVATNNKASNVWITAQNEQASTYTSGISTYKTFVVDAAVTETDEYTFNLGLRQVFDQWAAGATEVRTKDYHLYYIGSKVDFDEALCKMLQSYIDAASDFSFEPMNKNVRALFNAVVDEVQIICDKFEDGSMEISHALVVRAIERLFTARDLVQESIEAYKALGLQISSSYAKHLLYPQQHGFETFAAAMSDVETAYYNGDYADSAIPDAIIEVKGFTNRYMMADAVATAAVDNPMDVTARIVDRASLESDYFAPYWDSSVTPSVGYNGVAFSSGSFNFYQLLYGMPAGTYRLQACAFYRYGNQANNYNAYKTGSLRRNAKLYISHSEGAVTTDVMAISDDLSEQQGAGSWYAFDDKYVPDDMQAASVAVDKFGKYTPRNGYNSVDITVSSDGTLTIGAKKDAIVGGDWSFFGGFTLYYLGKIKHTLVLDENFEVEPKIDESITYDEVILKRTLKAGVWNSFVSPFNISVSSPILENWEIKELTHSSYKDGSLSLTFDDADGIKAGVPYMVRDTLMTEDITKIVMKGVKVNSELKHVTTPEGHVTFTGVYNYGPMPEGAFFISDNTFYQVPVDGDDSNNNKSKAFRAYLMPIGEAVAARSLCYRTDGQFEPEQDGDDTGEGEGDDTGEGEGDDTGEGEGDDTGEGEGDDTGEGEGDDTGEGEGDNTGEGEGDDTGEGEGDDTGEGEGDDTGEGEGDDTGEGEGDDNGNGDVNIESVVEEISVVAIYNANGVRVLDMQKGLNILQMSDGTRIRVLIR